MLLIEVRIDYLKIPDNICQINGRSVIYDIIIYKNILYFSIYSHHTQYYNFFISSVEQIQSEAAIFNASFAQQTFQGLTIFWD